MDVLLSAAASGRQHSNRAPTASMDAPMILALLLVMDFPFSFFSTSSTGRIRSRLPAVVSQFGRCWMVEHNFVLRAEYAIYFLTIEVDLVVLAGAGI